MTLKNRFGKCSLFVLSANGWKDRNMDSSFSLDCKKVVFFLKISKEIGNAWRKSHAGAKRASLTRP